MDGLPNVVMEALASGTPLVTTTAAGGIGAVVEDEVTAALVPERDVPALPPPCAGLAGDRSRRERIGGAGAGTRRASSYGWDRTAEQFESAYRRALAFKSTGR